MSRRRKLDIFEMLLEILEDLFRVIPPWTCIPVAALGYFTIVWWWTKTISDTHFAPAFAQFGKYFGLGFVIICLAAGFKGWLFRRDRKRFMAEEIDLDWVRKLSWQEFEKQVAAVYEGKGYTVEHTGGGGADGGIDLQLIKNGQKTMVQCKHWKTSKVGVKPVRELFGVMTAERADAAIFIASGHYTIEAEEFARGKPIQLVARDEFIKLVKQFQGALRTQHSHLPRETKAEVNVTEQGERNPSCPRCSNPMVLRRARTGKHVGKDFWGCSMFSKTKCHGTREC